MNLIKWGLRLIFLGISFVVMMWLINFGWDGFKNGFPSLPNPIEWFNEHRPLTPSEKRERKEYYEQQEKEKAEKEAEAEKQRIEENKQQKVRDSIVRRNHLVDYLDYYYSQEFFRGKTNQELQKIQDSIQIEIHKEHIDAEKRGQEEEEKASRIEGRVQKFVEMLLLYNLSYQKVELKAEKGVINISYWNKYRAKERYIFPANAVEIVNGYERLLQLVCTDRSSCIDDDGYLRNRVRVKNGIIESDSEYNEIVSLFNEIKVNSQKYTLEIWAKRPTN